MIKFVFSALVASALSISSAIAQAPDIHFRWSLHPFAEPGDPGEPVDPSEPVDPGPAEPSKPPIAFDGDFANPSFEASCSGWTGQCNVLGYGFPAASGTTSLSATWLSPIRQTISLAGPGTAERIDGGEISYNFSFYMMSRATSSGAVVLDWLDEGGAVIRKDSYSGSIDYFWQRHSTARGVPAGARSLVVTLPGSTGLNASVRYDHFSIGYFDGDVEVGRMGEPNALAPILNSDILNWGAEGGSVADPATVPGWYVLPTQMASSTSWMLESFSTTDVRKAYHAGGTHSFRPRSYVYGSVFAYQEVTLAAAAPAVSTGRATINFSGFANTPRAGGSQADRVSFEVEVLDAENKVIASDTRLVQPAEIKQHFQRFETTDVAIPPEAKAFRARFNFLEVSGPSDLQITVDHLRAEVKLDGAIVKTYGAPEPGPILGNLDLLNPSLVEPTALAQWGYFLNNGHHYKGTDAEGVPYLEMGTNTSAQQFLSVADVAAALDTGTATIDVVIQYAKTNWNDIHVSACAGTRYSPTWGSAQHTLTFFDIHGRALSTVAGDRLMDYGLANANHYSVFQVPAGTRSVLYSLSVVGMGATRRCNVRNVGLIVRRSQFGEQVKVLGTPYDLIDYYPQRLP